MEAGATLAHPHSQIIATPVTPRAIAVELEASEAHHHVKERCLFCDLIEQEVGAACSLVSTGPRREETIVREDPTLARLTAGRLGRVVAERHGA